MGQIIKWHNEAIGKKTVAALEKNHFTAEYAADKANALVRALASIPAGSSVGLGGSASRDEIGLTAALKERGGRIFDPFAPGLTGEESLAERRRSLTADVFVTGSNAVTLDGQLINVDGTGNRVAALAFGPGKVVVIVGANKIVPDIQTGLKRIKAIAGPANNKRLKRPNPCAVTGVCMDCDSPERICNITTITHKRPRQSDVHIIIVGEPLGF
ncbi:MAG: lactate utilization protein [Acidaminococcales bacterium]|jgi:L-lactate utilization protein LutB|nr:lactate utilization protein [Acidaminococcales bacterium]